VQQGKRSWRRTASVARLAAVIVASSITRIVKFNVRDYSPFTGIEAVHPEQVAELAASEI
jgi:hypothetical protein